MRALVVLLVACGPRVATTPVPPAPDLTLEVTPVKLGAHTPGELPEVTIAIVNHSKRTYLLPRPGPFAVDMPGTIYYEYERANADGTWSPLSRTFFMPIDRYPGEDPAATVELKPGARIVLDGRGSPRLTFSDEVVGKMRAHLVYDVDAEWARRKQPAPHVDAIVSNLVELDQLAGPLEVKLETIGPIPVATPIDLPHVLRVTVRNRSDRDVTIAGPGTDSGIGFDIDTPNGGVWPKGDRPEMGAPDGTGATRVLHAGEVVEVFGPAAALGAMPGTWTYPVAETFRLRANFYQKGPQRFHYSDWVELRSVP